MSVFDSVKKIVIGDVAHDAADSGSPVKFGGKASTTRPTAVATGDRVNAWFDEYGKQWTNDSTRFTYGYAYGGGAGTIVSTSDWYVTRNASVDGFSWPMDTVLASGNVLEFFDSDHGSFNEDPIWLLIPLAASNYTKANITIYNSLGVSMAVSAYLIPGNVALASVSPIANHAFSIIGDTDYPYTVADATRLHIGIGCTGDDESLNYISTDWIGGAVLLKCDPASDPGAGEVWQISVQRSR